MKTRYIIMFALATMFAVGCKSKSAALKSNDDSSIQIAVKYTEAYCGGAELSESEFEEMSQLKPFSNGVIYISTMIDPKTFINEDVVKLDKAGFASTTLDTGIYVVSFYSLMAPVVEDNKDGNKPAEPKLEAGDNPEPPSEGNISPEQELKECELIWKRMSAMPFKVVAGKMSYIIPLNKECNPCEPPRP